MTLTQYKKAIKSLSRDELETHLFEMFSASKVFKDVESSYWSEGYNDTLLSNLQKQLGKAFGKMQFSEFEKIIVITDPLGYGVSYDLEYLLANVRAELG